jgi:HEAT repeat protein
MRGASSRQVLQWVCGLAAVVLMAGCADLDFLPAWFPFQGPPCDKLSGVVTPAERQAQLRNLATAAGSAAPAERERISQQLTEEIKAEKDPLIRTEIIRALGNYPGPAADAILKAALSDADTHVRTVACEAWGRRGDSQAAKLLTEALRSDVETDVRLAAARALGDCKTPEAVAPLGEALSDANPAMQYRAMLSLQRVTGKDLGDDVARWQQYVKGQEPAPPSLAERFRRLF